MDKILNWILEGNLDTLQLLFFEDSNQNFRTDWGNSHKSPAAFFFSFDSVEINSDDVVGLIHRIKLINSKAEAVVQRCSVTQVFLKISQNSQGKTFARVSLTIKLQAQVCNFIKKDALAQVFSCEFCLISKNASGGCFW